MISLKLYLLVSLIGAISVLIGVYFGLRVFGIETIGAILKILLLIVVSAACVGLFFFVLGSLHPELYSW